MLIAVIAPITWVITHTGRHIESGEAPNKYMIGFFRNDDSI